MTSKLIAKTVVFNDAQQVLLLRRGQTDERRPGEWDFPGGGVEPGEDIFVGAAREIQEETGLVVPRSGLTLVYTATKPYEPADQSCSRFLFVARLTGSQEVQLSFEHDAYEWVDIETALVEFPHFFYAEGLRYAIAHDLLP